MNHRAPPPKMAATTAESLPFLHIPDEILLNILPRLPVKSLVRFRCVCRQWRRLLSGGDSEFNLLHRRLQRRRRFYLLRHHHDRRHSLSLVHADGNPSFLSPQLSPPQPRISDIMSTIHNEYHVDLEVVGSTLGLFCLAYNRGTCVVIWNPTTRDWYQVPDPLIPSVGFWTTSFGLAHDHGSVNHYKVVRVVYGRGNFLPSRNNWQVKAEVYDSSSNSWKQIANPPKVELSAKRCGVIVKGVPYWPAYRSECALPSSDSIVLFDPNSDAFTTFKRPDFGSNVEGGSNFSWRLGEVGGSLAVFVQKLDKSVDVWVMGDMLYECWVKQFSVPAVDKVVTWVKCWEDGEFLVSDYTYEYADHCRDLFLYDPWSNTTKTFPDFQSLEESRSYEVYVYEESFLSPLPSTYINF